MGNKETPDAPPKAPEAVKPKRLRLTKTQIKLYEQYLKNQNQAAMALEAAKSAATSFVLGVLAGHNIEGFITSNLEGEDLVYLPRESAAA